MKAADTSVVVAALAAWHEGHESARTAIAGEEIRLPAHCLLEAYSVLTRLPPPHRLDPRAALDLLRAFADAPLTLGKDAYASLLGRLVESGISGGAAYDALIGVTAAHHDALLLSRDRRAGRVYDLLGVGFEMVP